MEFIKPHSFAPSGQQAMRLPVTPVPDRSAEVHPGLCPSSPTAVPPLSLSPHSLLLPGPNGFPAFRAQSDWGWQSAATYGPLHTTPDGPASLLSGPIIHEAQRESSFHGAVYSPPVGNAFDSKFGGLSPYLSLIHI